MRRIAWWQPVVLALALLAGGLPLGARAVAGPPGARVHVRWQASVTEPVRQSLEARFQLADGQKLDESTWRYDLVDPSRENVRALVSEPAVADTHDIDRPNNAIDPAAIRTARRQRFPVGGDSVVTVADRLAITLAALAALLTLVRVTRLMPATRALWLRVNRVPISSAEDSGGDDRPRLWTAVVLVASSQAHS